MYDKRLDRMERQLTALLLGMQALIHKLSARESDEMSKLHDDLKTLAGEVDAAAGRVISAKTESESTLADVISQFQATRDKLNAAADAEPDPANGITSHNATITGPLASDEPAQSASTRTDATGGSS